MKEEIQNAFLHFLISDSPLYQFSRCSRCSLCPLWLTFRFEKLENQVRSSQWQIKTGNDLFINCPIRRWCEQLG